MSPKKKKNEEPRPTATSSGSTYIYNKCVDKALSTGSMIADGEKRVVMDRRKPRWDLSYSSFLDKRCSSFPARSVQLVELNIHKEPLVFRNLKIHANAFDQTNSSLHRCSFFRHIILYIDMKGYLQTVFFI